MIAANTIQTLILLFIFYLNLWYKYNESVYSNSFFAVKNIVTATDVQSPLAYRPKPTFSGQNPTVYSNTTPSSRQTPVVYRKYSVVYSNTPKGYWPYPTICGQSPVVYRTLLPDTNNITINCLYIFHL